MKRFLTILLFVAAASLLFAGSSSLSVPLESDAYRILKSAEVRGIIPTQSEVKPYSVALVRSLFSDILASGKITDAEKKVIEDLEAGFTTTYGEEANTSMLAAVEKYGYLTLVDDEAVSVSMGGKFSTAETIAAGDVSAVDSRNKITAYVRGDVYDTVSFYMDFSMLFDKVDHNAFLATDFTTECEGWYQNFFNGGEKIMTSPFDGIGGGLGMSPEVSASLLDNSLLVRFGAIKRDWGPGRNNLALAGSARSFDGVEFTYAPTSAFNFSWLLGSLGKSYLALDGEAPVPADADLHTNVYDNNFTSQRVEISPIKGLKAAVYETVVWRKRSELAYLNPLGVYMFSQNYIGDFDNMLAGVDMSYTLSGVGKAYFSLAIDEYNSVNPKTWFSFARNIVAAQGGVNLYVPVFSFSQLTLQATYIPPFFGAHYTFTAGNNPWGTTAFEIDYVNKGQTLSYPLYPDSIELLAAFETNLPMGLSLDVVAKDQMRSAQYSENSYGTALDTTMKYKVGSKYADKAFFSYIWNNIVDVSATVSKSFDNLPLKVYAGAEAILDSRRTFVSNTTDYNYRKDDGTLASATIVDGKHNVMNDDWNTTVKLVGKVGVSLYY